MKIASADVALTSQHSYSEATASMESVKLVVDKGNTDVNQIDFLKLEVDTLEISDQARHLQMSQDGSISKLSGQEVPTVQLSESDKRKIELIQYLFKSLTGKRIKFLIPQKNEYKISSNNINFNYLNTAQVQLLKQPQPIRWGLSYNQTVIHAESESTSFNARAAIKTEDGREIKVDLQLNLSREFMAKNQIDVSAVNISKVDPLVVNYSASSASVTQEKYQFDIDADGTLDQISFAGAGSGFLALDLNKDGVINDGKELFGPNSGNGFSDLANYDTDKNGWIDENDAIYENLRIWTKDSEGNDQLFALGEKGIGAIYLGNVSTSFALKDTSNQTNAQLQRTGIFLREDGTAGTIQHIDLAI